MVFAIIRPLLSIYHALTPKQVAFLILQDEQFQIYLVFFSLICTFAVKLKIRYEI